MSLRDLIQEEHDILDNLGLAANKLGRLPASHPSDMEEFMFHIHACQNIILAKPATEYIAQASEQAEHLRSLQVEASGPAGEQASKLARELQRAIEEFQTEKSQRDEEEDSE